MHLSTINILNLLSGQVLFILKFFAEVILVFVMGGVIGTLLHLDRAENSDAPSHFHS